MIITRPELNALAQNKIVDKTHKGEEIRRRGSSDDSRRLTWKVSLIKSASEIINLIPLIPLIRQNSSLSPRKAFTQLRT